jgi:predicted DNA-binding transcriptional regulator AlpA
MANEQDYMSRPSVEAYIKECLGLTASEIKDLIEQGNFPQPKKIGDTLKWKRSVVTNWINGKSEAFWDK